MKQVSYTKQDGKWHRTITDVSDDDTPQKQRAKAMAEVHPERIVFAWTVPGSEEEKYLDEL